MEEPLEQELKSISAGMRQDAGRRLLRFFLAAVTAFLVALLTILFMRYLIVGYDRSASAALTRYISVPSLMISRNKGSGIARIERPGELPETPLLEDDDVQQASSAYLDENTLGMPDMTRPLGTIDQDIALPSLDEEPSSDREKMSDLKQAILNAED